MAIKEDICNPTVAALATALLLLAQSAPVSAACVGRIPPFVPDGTTYTAGSTPAGQPCQFGLGLLGGHVQVLRITVRPLHGVLGLSAQEENRRYIAYAPTAGYVGPDRFEVFLQVVQRGRTVPTMTRIRVDMTITPWRREPVALASAGGVSETAPNHAQESPCSDGL